MIKINQLDFYFGKQQILNNINLYIPDGSIYGFLGPNGAGKTTTIKIILGLLRYNKGEVLVNGQNLKTHKLNILSKTGSLIENPSLYGHLSGYQNLQIAAKLQNVNKNRINEVLETTGLTAAASKKTRKYSNGMKQRLGIATALLADPGLLILDEPVNGLDPEGMVEMRQLFIRLKRKGKTLFISSHLLSEIEKSCTHIGIINQGKILFEGTMEQLHKTLHKQLSVEFDTSSPQNALNLVKEKHPCFLKDTRLVVENIQKTDAASVNELLVRNNIRVFQIIAQNENLEEAFIKVISKPG